MNKITIYKKEDNLLISVDDNVYLFNYNMLLNTINEVGLPCKVVALGLSGSFINKICSNLRNNNIDVKSFNAFSDKDAPNKYILKLKEKNIEKRR